MAADAAEGKKWVRRFHPSPQAPVRLICLPHAGGSATSFFALSQALAPHMDVLAVQYPGRGDRLDESPVGDLHALADSIADALAPWRDRPLALFGHSMGALLGFEVARRLQTTSNAPRVLFASARRAPSRYRSRILHRLPDHELLAELRRLSGTDARFFEDEELLRLFLPAIRSDYRAVETYVPGPFAVVGCPVVALMASDDDATTPEEVHAWSAHTTGGLEVCEFPGGHFYLNDQVDDVAELVSKRVL